MPLSHSQLRWRFIDGFGMVAWVAGMVIVIGILAIVLVVERDLSRFVPDVWRQRGDDLPKG